MTSGRVYGSVVFSLWLCLAVGMAIKEELPEVKSVVGEDCTLPCPAVFKPGVQYLALSWYKDIDSSSSRLSGLLTRDLPNGPTRWYLGLDREVELLNNSSDIFIPNLTCADRGVYTCHLAAPIGEQNREKEILLTVSDCPDELSEISITDTYMVIFASVLLLFALLVFGISYVCLRNTVKDKKERTHVETVVDSARMPLSEKEILFIQTLGKVPKKSMMKLAGV